MLEGLKDARLFGSKNDQPRHVKQKQEQRHFFPLLPCVLIAFILTIVFHSMFGIAIVSGKSMEPTLHEGDVILFWKLSRSYEKGEIVLIKTNGQVDYVKRVCAVPNDTVTIDDASGCLFVNGERQAEPYIDESTYSKTEVEYPLVLSEQEYFVLGDCRSVSWDSRSYGAVHGEQMDGKVIFLFRGVM
ncbi:MAG TPA: signal peptidase I [Clostridiales bacterium]|nr:signal peptidase I [Clostridiales bacterium]